MAKLTKLIKKNDRNKLISFGIAVLLWVMLYILAVVPMMNNYYIAHPNSSQPLGFIINIAFIFVSVFFLAFILDGLLFAFRFASALSLDLFGLVLIQSPLCLSPKTGEILLSQTNFSCSWAEDIFASNILKLFGISGYSLYATTYIIFGSILFIIGGIIMYYTLKNKIKK